MRRSPGARAGLLGAAGSVAGLTLVSRALGFVRWVVQASTVGAGAVAGAYSTANQVPNVLYEVVVGGALAATIVPMLATAVRTGRSQDAERTASGLLGTVLVLLVPLAVLLAVLADPIAALFPLSQGADPGYQHQLVADFLRMFALQVPLYGVGVVLTGVLQAHGRFTWPALTPVASSLVVMATYAVYGRMSAASPQAPSHQALEVLGWGTTAGVAALSLPLVWPVARLGLRIRPSLRLRAGELRRLGRLGGAGLWTLLAQQASVLVVLALARSGGQAGTVAVYQYTQAVYVLPYAVLAVPVSTVLYPRLAAALGQGSPDGAAVTELAARSTALVAAVAAAGAGALVAVSHGAQVFFSLLTDVDGMGQALAVAAPGLVGYALIFQVTRVLFAADRAGSGAAATCLGWVGVIVVSVLAVHVMAPQGGDSRATLVALSVGLTAGMSLAGLGLLVALARLLGAAVLWPVLRALVVAGAAAALGGLAALRVTTTLVGQVPTAVYLAVCLVAALTVAAASLGLALAADRRLVGVLRRRSAETDADAGQAGTMDLDGDGAQEDR
ncbi:murein biosynthesis integral membrane protein MurJ [Actinomyces faecalis]|uniref:murein biosynthesis integral membrane protein MurJ n=1 Tax=Actinomyces faecalis TaxID=2722820 RepID=UPI001555CDA7|nr:lipid II flippase MurJ [Actinomyces faecalis]